MLLNFDKTDFPLLVVSEVGVEVHLLPVTKAQFDLFTADSPLVKPPQYRAMLATNPAVAPDEFTAANRERVFVGGVQPAEALAFAGWLGQGFDLPTVDEWRAICAALEHEPPPRQRRLTETVTGPAGVILNRLEEQLTIRSLLDYTLLLGGLVEWVRQGERLAGIGRPRPGFHANLWDPFKHTIKPIDITERLPYFGFRLVRRGSWYLRDSQRAVTIF